MLGFGVFFYLFVWVVWFLVFCVVSVFVFCFGGLVVVFCLVLFSKTVFFLICTNFPIVILSTVV